MRRVCIAAYQGKSIVSRLIRWRTWSSWSHVAWLGLDGGLIDAWVSSGVRRVVTISEGHQPGTRVQTFSVDLTEEQDRKIQAFLNAQIGKGYDWRGVFGFLARSDYQNRTKWFCSELVAEAFMHGGVALQLKPSWKTSPGDIVESPLARKEWSSVTV